MTPGFKEGRLLRVFLDEADRSGLQPKYTAIVDFLHKGGASGATVFRGIEGFGGHDQLHAANVFSWRPNLPILIVVVDEAAVLEPLLPQLEAMLGEGLVTVEDVEFLRLSRRSGQGR